MILYLDYSGASHKKLMDVYHNIKALLNIENFGFLKVYRDGQFYYLNSDLSIARNYITQVTESNIFFKENIDSVDFNNEKYYFIAWPEAPLSKSMDIYYSQGIWNGLTCMNYDEDSISMWWVASTPENNNIVNLYNQKVFRKQFLIAIDYFKKQTYLLLDKIDKKDFPSFVNSFHFNNLSAIGNQEALQSEKTASLIKFLYPKGILIETRNGLVNLTPKETEILKYMSRGFSSKEIANIFGNMPKTIENHKDTIKHKTGYTLRSDFVELYNSKLKLLLE